MSYNCNISGSDEEDGRDRLDVTSSTSDDELVEYRAGPMNKTEPVIESEPDSEFEHLREPEFEIFYPESEYVDDPGNQMLLETTTTNRTTTKKIKVYKWVAMQDDSDRPGTWFLKTGNKLKYNLGIIFYIKTCLRVTWAYPKILRIWPQVTGVCLTRAQ